MQATRIGALVLICLSILFAYQNCSEEKAKQNDYVQLLEKCFDVMPVCAAPPPGCEYKPLPPDENGCPQPCGELVCKEILCPQVGYLCSPPPKGCDYSGAAHLDENGCPIGCGDVTCTAQ